MYNFARSLTQELKSSSRLSGKNLKGTSKNYFFVSLHRTLRSPLSRYETNDATNLYQISHLYNFFN